MPACKAFNNNRCSCCAQKKQISSAGNVTYTATTPMGFDSHNPNACYPQINGMPSNNITASPVDYSSVDLNLSKGDTTLSRHQADNNSPDTSLVSDDISILDTPSNSSADITFASEEVPLTELHACDNNFQSANTLIEATDRFIGTIAEFLSRVNIDNNKDAKLCGLLHFKEWWELVGVNICVNGEQISGIPMSITENAIRVIDNDYSYFIPLEKVDYIRTNDGLLSDFDS